MSSKDKSTRKASRAHGGDLNGLSHLSSSSAASSAAAAAAASSSAAAVVAHSSSHHHPSFAAAASAASSAASSAVRASTPRFLHPLHRCRFPTFLPSGVISLNYSPSGRRLAVGRSNGNIEIWNTGDNTSSSGWTCVKTIPGVGEPTVQVIRWARSLRSGREDRLFTAGLNGRLIEWDLINLAPKFASDSYGGAVWSGAVCKREGTQEQTLTMALGCEDGTIRLFDLSEDQGPIYLKSLSRHTSRVLSVAFSPDGNFICSGGSDGMIKLWELEEGRNIQRITVENKGLKRTTVADANTKKKRGEGEKYETLIWCLEFLSPATIVAGDSLGNLQIWDLEFGTLKQSFNRALHGDILTLAVNAAKTSIYAAGVEGKIVEVKAVVNGSEERGLEDAKWVVTANHRHHTHDVYALALSPNVLPLATAKNSQQLSSPKLQAANAPAAASSTANPSTAANHVLVSGGVDTQLLLSPTANFPEYSSISRILPFPQGNNSIAVADKIIFKNRDGESVKLPPRFLVTHDQHLQLYGVGDINFESTAEKLRSKELFLKEKDTLPLEKGYVHLLDINVNSRKSQDASNASVWVPGGGLNLICSALSRDGRFIACSDPIQVKLYHVHSRSGSSNPHHLLVNKIKINHLVQPASVLAFSADSTKLFIASLTGAIEILDLATLKLPVPLSEDADDDNAGKKVAQVQTLSEHVPEAVYEGDLSSDDEDMSDVGTTKKSSKRAAAKLGLLRSLAVSHDSQYLAVGDELNHIWVYNLDTMRLACTLPVFAQTLLSMEFSPNASTQLAILCAKNTLYIYDVERQKLTDYTKQNLMSLLTSTTASAASLAKDQFVHLSFDRSGLTHANSLLLQSVNNLLHINLDKPRPRDGMAVAQTGTGAAASLNRRDRKRKMMEEAGNAGVSAPAADENDASADPLQANFRLINRFRPLLFGAFIDESAVDSTGAAKNKAQIKGAGDKKKRKKGHEDDASSAIADDGVDSSVDPTMERPVLVGSSLLVIEAPWLNILQNLPQPMARHRYGS